MLSVNKFPMEFGQLSENPLSLPCTANSCGLVGRLLLQVSFSLITGDYTELCDYKVRFPLPGSHYIPDLLHEFAIRIHRLKTLV